MPKGIPFLDRIKEVGDMRNFAESDIAIIAE
jgi:hypothetical protein